MPETSLLESGRASEQSGPGREDVVDEEDPGNRVAGDAPSAGDREAALDVRPSPSHPGSGLVARPRDPLQQLGVRNPEPA